MRERDGNMASWDGPDGMASGPAGEAGEATEALLADLVTVGLDARGRDELDRLLGGPVAGGGGESRGGFESELVLFTELAAASMAVAEIDEAGGPESAPESFLAAAREAGRRYAASELSVASGAAGAAMPAGVLADESSSGLRLSGTEATAAAGAAAGPGDPRVPMLAWSGWIAAAACLGVAFLVATPPGGETPEPTVAQRLDTLRDTGGDVVSVAWAGMDALGAETHTYDAGVGGEVVWSDERNEGYMEISGLAANDPGTYQYQLWIFDAKRPIGQLPQHANDTIPILSQRPVDGGVFDFTPGEDGRAVVAIDPKLRVGKAALFAVTVEPPGGVVVSDRDIVFVAAVGS